MPRTPPAASFAASTPRHLPSIVSGSGRTLVGHYSRRPLDGHTVETRKSGRWRDSGFIGGEVDVTWKRDVDEGSFGREWREKAVDQYRGNEQQRQWQRGGRATPVRLPPIGFGENTVMEIRGGEEQRIGRGPEQSFVGDGGRRDAERVGDPNTRRHDRMRKPDVAVSHSSHTGAPESLTPRGRVENTSSLPTPTPAPRRRRSWLPRPVHGTSANTADAEYREEVKRLVRATHVDSAPEMAESNNEAAVQPPVRMNRNRNDSSQLQGALFGVAPQARPGQDTAITHSTMQAPAHQSPPAAPAAEVNRTNSVSSIPPIPRGHDLPAPSLAPHPPLLPHPPSLPPSRRGRSPRLARASLQDEKPPPLPSADPPPPSSISNVEDLQARGNGSTQGPGTRADPQPIDGSSCANESADKRTSGDPPPPPTVQSSSQPPEPTLPDPHSLELARLLSHSRSKIAALELSLRTTKSKLRETDKRWAPLETAARVVAKAGSEVGGRGRKSSSGKRFPCSINNSELPPNSLPLGPLELLHQLLLLSNLHQTASILDHECNFTRRRLGSRLKRAMAKRDFSDAVETAKEAWKVAREDVKQGKGYMAEDSGEGGGDWIDPGFSDLLYLLRRYLCVSHLLRGDGTAARLECDRMRSLLPGVFGDPGEDDDGESTRRRWYEDNLTRLTHLAAHLSTSPGSAPAPNELKAWDWDKEVGGFWNAVRSGGSGGTFGDAVGWMVGSDGKGQLGDVEQDSGETNSDWPEWDLLTLSQVIAEVTRAVSVRPVRGLGEGAENTEENSGLLVDEVEHIKVSVVPAPSTPAKVDQDGALSSSAERSNLGSKTPSAGKHVDSNPQASLKPPTNPSSPRRPRTPPSTVGPQHHAHPPASDGRSAVSSVSFAEFDTSPLLPPAPSRPESAEFAFAGSCGPFVSAARALDVAVRPDGSIISATCPADPHLDRTISIHLLTLPGPHLMRSLDTGTPRPVVALSFHPSNPSWLLTADMDHCVKLWDVDSGAVLRTWRKWHTRVVHRCGWVPHTDARAWTCSGDQSVKVWDATGDEGDEDVARVHGTEPFVGVVFSGQGVGQMMVVAMAYAVRVYRVRTMGVLRTVVFGELRGSKTPITCISSHPAHDSFALVSCDNQVRLVELAGMTTLKVYNAREIGPGTRIEAHFSPCGAFVYAGSLDPRTLSQHTPGLQPSNTSPTYSQRYGLPRPTLSGPPESVLPPSETSQYHSPLGTGVFVWRVHTGKLERVEMMAMETGAGARVGVGACRWVAAQGDKEQVGARGGKKVLVSAGSDRVLRVFR